MADREVNIVISAVDKFSDNFNKATKGISSLGEASAGIGTLIGGIATGLLATGTALVANELIQNMVEFDSALTRIAQNAPISAEGIDKLGKAFLEVGEGSSVGAKEVASLAEILIKTEKDKSPENIAQQSKNLAIATRAVGDESKDTATKLVKANLIFDETSDVFLKQGSSIDAVKDATVVAGDIFTTTLVKSGAAFKQLGATQPELIGLTGTIGQFGEESSRTAAKLNAFAEGAAKNADKLLELFGEDIVLPKTLQEAQDRFDAVNKELKDLREGKVKFNSEPLQKIDVELEGAEKAKKDLENTIKLMKKTEFRDVQDKIDKINKKISDTRLQASKLVGEARKPVDIRITNLEEQKRGLLDLKESLEKVKLRPLQDDLDLTNDRIESLLDSRTELIKQSDEEIKIKIEGLEKSKEELKDVPKKVELAKKEIARQKISENLEKDFTGTIIKITTKLDEIPNSLERSEKAQELFGASGAEVVTRLSGRQDELRKNIDLATKAWDDGTGALKENAIFEESVAGKAKILQSNFDNLKISIGGLSEAPIKGFLNFLNFKFFETGMNIDIMNKSLAGLQSFISSIPSLIPAAVKALEEFAATIGTKLTGLFSADIFKDIKTTLADSFNEIIKSLTKNIEEFQSIVSKIFKFIFIIATAAITFFIDQFVNPLIRGINKIRDFFIQLASHIADTFNNVIDALQKILDGIEEGLENLGNAFIGFIREFANKIAGIIPAARSLVDALAFGDLDIKLDKLGKINLDNLKNLFGTPLTELPVTPIADLLALAQQSLTGNQVPVDAHIQFAIEDKTSAGVKITNVITNEERQFNTFLENNVTG